MEVHSVEQLARRFSANWPFLEKGREASKQTLRAVEMACKSLVMPDTSLVVFGSLAREEFTLGSDIDWTLLVDGFTVPEHIFVARQIGKELENLGLSPPGLTGTFGNITSSHNLIHCIGGEDDTNANTTRRSLLLLESRSIGDAQAFNRVRNNLLRRYLEEDLGLWKSSTIQKVPHFLLNDFARYWRTMAVDFADKQHDRFHEGFALRNIKLRMSRKLIYISGLLACFRCHLSTGDEGERIRFFTKENSLEVAALLRSFLDMTPLDLCAETLFRFGGHERQVMDFFSAYDHFVGVLSDAAKRQVLKTLKPEQLESDPVYCEARKISHEFRQAVDEIFLSADNEIGNLTIKYGVF
jgi:predicted nucleotidyltransferase